MNEQEVLQVGEIKHFFPKINVAVVELTAPLSVGDRITIKGPSTDFEMNVDSMQIEYENIQCAPQGQSIGLKLASPAKERDLVYKIF